MIQHINYQLLIVVVLAISPSTLSDFINLTDIIIFDEDKNGCVSVEENKCYGLKCRVNHRDQCELLSWTQGRHILSVGAKNEITYNFKPTRKDHLSKFTCEIFNKSKMTRRSRVIVLLVRYRPLITAMTFTSEQILERRDRYRMVCCETSSFPKPSIWIAEEDGSVLSERTSMESKFCQTLDDNIKRTITCIANNSVGHSIESPKLSIADNELHFQPSEVKPDVQHDSQNYGVRVCVETNHGNKKASVIIKAKGIHVYIRGEKLFLQGQPASMKLYRGTTRYLMGKLNQTFEKLKLNRSIQSMNIVRLHVNLSNNNIPKRDNQEHSNCYSSFNGRQAVLVEFFPNVIEYEKKSEAARVYPLVILVVIVIMITVTVAVFHFKRKRIRARENNDANIHVVPDGQPIPVENAIYFSANPMVRSANHDNGVTNRRSDLGQNGPLNYAELVFAPSSNQTGRVHEREVTERTQYSEVIFPSTGAETSTFIDKDTGPREESSKVTDKDTGPGTTSGKVTDKNTGPGAASGKVTDKDTGSGAGSSKVTDKDTGAGAESIKVTDKNTGPVAGPSKDTGTDIGSDGRDHCVVEYPTRDYIKVGNSLESSNGVSNKSKANRQNMEEQELPSYGFSGDEWASDECQCAGNILNADCKNLKLLEDSS